jgi:hypothetical protein
MPRSTTSTQPPAAPLALAERPSPDITPFAPEPPVCTWADPQAELVAALAALVRYHLDTPSVSDSAAAAPLAPAA